MAKGGVVAGGITLLFIAIIGYFYPVTELTIPQVNDLCVSGIGQLGQLFSGDVQKICREFSYLMFGIYGFGLIGIILIIVGSVVPGKKKEVESNLEERYAKGELTKGEFESKKSDIEPKKDETHIQILKERYAKGEITKEEFEKMKKDLV